MQSRQYRIGLIICAMLGVVDVESIAGVGADDGPPTAVQVIGFVVGFVTLAGVWLAWRGDDRGCMAVAAFGRGPGPQRRAARPAQRRGSGALHMAH